MESCLPNSSDKTVIEEQINRCNIVIWCCVIWHYDRGCVPQWEEKSSTNAWQSNQWPQESCDHTEDLNASFEVPQQSRIMDTHTYGVMSHKPTCVLKHTSDHWIWLECTSTYIGTLATIINVRASATELRKHTCCIPETKIDRFAIYHHICRIIIKHCRDVFTGECICCVTD